MISLDLSNNLIGYDGSRFLSQAIKTNKTLQSLNLKLNNIKDKGGAKFFRDLVDNKTLQYLNVSANSLEKAVIFIFMKMLMIFLVFRENCRIYCRY